MTNLSATAKSPRLFAFVPLQQADLSPTWSKLLRQTVAESNIFKFKGSNKDLRHDKQNSCVCHCGFGACCNGIPLAACIRSKRISIFRSHKRDDLDFSAYRAGLRHGMALGSAYGRGYIDGMRMVVSRSSVYSVNPTIPSSGYSTDHQYSSGHRSADYDQPTGRAPAYEGLYASTQIPDGHWAADHAAPQAIPQYSAEAYRYCVARYRSFDPASGTFLAYDGNRYDCR
jgi:hypothetical protein